MRKLIAAFKTSVDGKIEGQQGFADWVEGTQQQPSSLSLRSSLPSLRCSGSR